MQVSLIVPVYNSEKYLKYCIDSVLNQSIQNFELILVDNCSTDRSGELIESYKKKYPDVIKCLHLDTNRMAGGAREAGLQIAQGEYVTFIDSDDYISPYYCEKLFQKAVEEDADITICDYYKVAETKPKRYCTTIFQEDSGVLDSTKRKALLLSIPGMCMRLYRRSLFEKYKIPFAADIRMGEELVTNHLCCLYAEKIGKVEEALYYYRENNESSMHVANDPSIFTLSSSAELDYKTLKERGFYEEYQQEIDFCFIKFFYAVMLEECTKKFERLPYVFMEELRERFMEKKIEAQKNKYFVSMLTPLQRALVEWNTVSPEFLEKKLKSNMASEYSYRPYYENSISGLKKLWIKFRDKEIAVWGAGAKGRALLQVAIENNLPVACLIDSNPDLIGTSLPSGHNIVSFNQVKQNIKVILIVNMYYYGDICTQYKDEMEQQEVINLDYWLIFDKK